MFTTGSLYFTKLNVPETSPQQRERYIRRIWTVLESAKSALTSEVLKDELKRFKCKEIGPKVIFMATQELTHQKKLLSDKFKELARSIPATNASYDAVKNLIPSPGSDSWVKAFRPFDSSFKEDMELYVASQRGIPSLIGRLESWYGSVEKLVVSSSQRITEGIERAVVIREAKEILDKKLAQEKEREERQLEEILKKKNEEYQKQLEENQKKEKKAQEEVKVLTARKQEIEAKGQKPDEDLENELEMAEVTVCDLVAEKNQIDEDFREKVTVPLTKSKEIKARRKKQVRNLITLSSCTITHINPISQEKRNLYQIDLDQHALTDKEAKYLYVFVSKFIYVLLFVT